MVNVEKPTKEEFADWKQQQMTQNFFQHVYMRREQVKEELVQQGMDQHSEDVYRKGYCRALQHILEVDFMEPEEEPND